MIFSIFKKISLVKKYFLLRLIILLISSSNLVLANTINSYNLNKDTNSTHVNSAKLPITQIKDLLKLTQELADDDSVWDKAIEVVNNNRLNDKIINGLIMKSFFVLTERTLLLNEKGKAIILLNKLQHLTKKANFKNELKIDLFLGMAENAANLSLSPKVIELIEEAEEIVEEGRYSQLYMIAGSAYILNQAEITVRYLDKVRKIIFSYEKSRSVDRMKDLFLSDTFSELVEVILKQLKPEKGVELLAKVTANVENIIDDEYRTETFISMAYSALSMKRFENASEWADLAITSLEKMSNDYKIWGIQRIQGIYLSMNNTDKFTALEHKLLVLFEQMESTWDIRDTTLLFAEKVIRPLSVTSSFSTGRFSIISLLIELTDEALIKIKSSNFLSTNCTNLKNDIFHNLNIDCSQLKQPNKYAKLFSKVNEGKIISENGINKIKISLIVNNKATFYQPNKNSHFISSLLNLFSSYMLLDPLAFEEPEIYYLNSQLIVPIDFLFVSLVDIVGNPSSSQNDKWGALNIVIRFINNRKNIRISTAYLDKLYSNIEKINNKDDRKKLLYSLSDCAADAYHPSRAIAWLQIAQGTNMTNRRIREEQGRTYLRLLKSENRPNGKNIETDWFARLNAGVEKVDDIIERAYVIKNLSLNAAEFGMPKIADKLLNNTLKIYEEIENRYSKANFLRHLVEKVGDNPGYTIDKSKWLDKVAFLGHQIPLVFKERKVWIELSEQATKLGYWDQARKFAMQISDKTLKISALREMSIAQRIELLGKQ